MSTPTKPPNGVVRYISVGAAVAALTWASGIYFNLDGKILAEAKERAHGIEELRKEIRDDIKDIRVEQKTISDEQTSIGKNQVEIKTLLLEMKKSIERNGYQPRPQPSI